MVRAEDGPDAALADLDRNIELLTPLLVREPNSVAIRDVMFRTHGLRATLLNQPGRLEESVAANIGCMEYAPPEMREFRRLFVVMARVRAGHFEQAADETAAIVSALPDNVNPDWLEHLAHVLSLAAAGVQSDFSRP